MSTSSKRHHRLARLLPCALLLALSSGCATMTAQQCASADWYGLGAEDGLAGQSSSHYQHRDAACVRHGINTDAGRYYAGRMEGLRNYCTVENGLRAGKSGNPYHGVCPDDAEKAFLSGYYLGALSAFSN